MIIESIIFALSVSSLVSTETTGRGITDHAISAANGKDCKLVRVVQNEKICQDEAKGTVTVTAIPAKVSPMGTDSVTQANDIFAARARKHNESNKAR